MFIVNTPYKPKQDKKKKLVITVEIKKKKKYKKKGISLENHIRFINVILSEKKKVSITH